MRIVVGISGASGAILGIRALQMLRAAGCETHLVISRYAARTIVEETEYSLQEVRQLASTSYAAYDLGAAIASGSFQTSGMIIAPCSIKSAAEVAYGTTSTLLTRAADVTLKEHRRLVLLVRESPLHIGHLRMLMQLSEAGGIVVPPVPAFYAKPKAIDDLVNQMVGRALELLGVNDPSVRHWPEGGSGDGNGNGDLES